MGRGLLGDRRKRKVTCHFKSPELSEGSKCAHIALILKKQPTDIRSVQHQWLVFRCSSGRKKASTEALIRLNRIVHEETLCECNVKAMWIKTVMVIVNRVIMMRKKLIEEAGWRRAKIQNCRGGKAGAQRPPWDGSNQMAWADLFLTGFNIK